MDEKRVRERLTGTVAGGFAVAVDTRGSAVCRACGRTLGSGDRVSAAFRNYEGYTWELLGIYCSEDRIERITEVMEENAEEQAVVEATLEPTGYHDPLGEFHPDVLTFGAIDLLDFSPDSTGYE